HVRIVEIEIGLVTEEAMPVVRLRYRIPGSEVLLLASLLQSPVVRLRYRVPGPVGRLRVTEDDARAGVTVGRVAPDIVVTLWRPGWRAACCLEPRMLVRRVIDDELGDDAQAAAVSLLHE